MKKYTRVETKDKIFKLIMRKDTDLNMNNGFLIIESVGEYEVMISQDKGYNEEKIVEVNEIKRTHMFNMNEVKYVEFLGINEVELDA